MTSDRVGTRTCLRLVLRRDRILLPVWLVVLAAVAASSAAATVGIYPTAAARRAAAEAVNAAPALVALYGRIYDPSNLGGIAMLKMTGFGGVLVAILMAPHRDPAHARRRGGRPHRAHARRGARPAGPAAGDARSSPWAPASCSACSPPWA